MFPLKMFFRALQHVQDLACFEQKVSPQGPARVQLLPITTVQRVHDKMAQIVMVSQVQRNSQRGVGTACQSRVSSHSQGCHWRKRLESCIETEREGGMWMKNRGRGGETH